jgi:hypothetical protein
MLQTIHSYQKIKIKLQSPFYLLPTRTQLENTEKSETKKSNNSLNSFCHKASLDATDAKNSFA